MENITQSQKSYIRNIKLEDSYKFYNQLDDGNIRLLHSNNSQTLTISVEDLKFLIDNELITVADLNITAAGRIAIMPGVAHAVNKQKLEQFKQDVHQDDELQKQERLRQLQEQREAEHKAELQRLSAERSNVFKAVIGIFNDFKRDNVPKEFKASEPKKKKNQQSNNSSVQSVNSNATSGFNNIPSGPPAPQKQYTVDQVANNASQYAMSMNNPNLDEFLDL